MLVGGGALVTALRMPASAITEATPATTAIAPEAATVAPVEAAVVVQPQTMPVAPATVESDVVAPAAEADPALALQAEFAKREADYLKTIAEANQRIELANADNQMLAKRLVTGNVIYIKAPAARYAVSTKRAAQIALATAKGSKLHKTELVKYNGVVAYEVQLDKGAIYVNAKNGAVLHDATVPAAVAANVSGSNSATQPLQQVAAQQPAAQQPAAQPPAAQPPAAQPPAAQPPAAQPSQPDHDDDDDHDEDEDHEDDHDEDKGDDHGEDHD